MKMKIFPIKLIRCCFGTCFGLQMRPKLFLQQIKRKQIEWSPVTGATLRPQHLRPIMFTPCQVDMLEVEDSNTHFGGSDPFLSVCCKFNAVCDCHQPVCVAFLNCIRTVRPNLSKILSTAFKLFYIA